MKRTLALLTAAAAIPLLAIGCADVPEPSGPGFGNAVTHNAEVQIIDPEPALAGRETPDLDGRRGALAIQRYKTGKTIEPERQRMSGAAGGGGGGGGSR
jgi:hypothetical protein